MALIPEPKVIRACGASVNGLWRFHEHNEPIAVAARQAARPSKRLGDPRATATMAPWSATLWRD